MYGLIYFDTEDFFSPPDSPVHRLPGQLADVMARHGLQGCFHIHGEKARFMERHGQTDVIESIRKHDVSLHYDRGSIHPTTAEEVSRLDWFRAVDRVLYREVRGFQDLQRIFGRCSALTQHGGTFAASIVYAVGKLGKPFFYSPFRLPGREVVWFCNNLLFGGFGGREGVDFSFDRFYRDTPRFDVALAKAERYLDERAKAFDLTCMFGCHPVNTIMEKFPDAINFDNGASPPAEDWVAPTLVPGVSIPLILENFERLVEKLIGRTDVEWTTVQGICELYRRRPASVPDSVVLEGARAVVAHGGPTYTSTLSAAELLVLLAQRAAARADRYSVPQVMGPTDEGHGPTDVPPDALAPEAVAREILDVAPATGYLPAVLSADNKAIAPELALWLLACNAAGAAAQPPDARRLCIEAIPGAEEALANVAKYKDWRCHGPQYHQPGILDPFRLQCWTLKPALQRHEYGPDVDLGVGLSPVF